MQTKKNIDDTLPAFPCVRESVFEGMTLRDYFAAAALSGLASDDGLTHEQAAQHAYDHADAMVLARQPADKDKVDT